MQLDRSLTTFDGLHPAETTFFQQLYAREGLDLSSYNKVMIEDSPSQYRHVSDTVTQGNSKPQISLQNRNRFEQSLNEIIVRNLAASERFTMTDSVGSEVVTLWGTLVDVHTETTAEVPAVAEFILVLELRDSITQDTLVRAVHPTVVDLGNGDEQGRWDRLSAASEELATHLRDGLDQLFQG